MTAEARLVVGFVFYLAAAGLVGWWYLGPALADLRLRPTRRRR